MASAPTIAVARPESRAGWPAIAARSGVTGSAAAAAGLLVRAGRHGEHGERGAEQSTGDAGRETPAGRHRFGRGGGAAAATAAGRDGVVPGDRVAVADAGLGQVELHVPGGGPVTVERGDDRAGLLVAGGEQEGRGTAVGLHADGVVAGLGVGQLVGAV